MSNENQILSDFLKHTTSTSVLYTELLESISFHLNALNRNVIDSDDFANAIEEIFVEHTANQIK
jgi:hypothetical protein